DAIPDFHVTGVQTCALPICVGQLLPAAERPGLLAYWFAPDDMHAYSMTVSYDCAIVGNLNALRQELLYDLFALPKGSGFVIGALQDLVRAKRLTGYGEGYRSRLLPYRDGKQIGHRSEERRVGKAGRARV